MKHILYIIAILFATLQAYSQTYTYDNLNRLTKVVYDNGITVTYGYDALGNRTSKKVTGASSSTTVICDVNGDGYVTAADITALYDYLLNNNTSNLVNGDVNGDGYITAGDVTTVYDILLNGTGSGSNSTSSYIPSEGLVDDETHLLEKVAVDTAVDVAEP